MKEVIAKVEKSIQLYEQGNIPSLKQQLYELYSEFNKVGGGEKIINYPRKDQLAECFTLMLKFDWINDKEIREVWAENGFYCLIKYMSIDVQTQVDQVAAGLDLFLHLNSGGGDSLIPKFNDILKKNKALNICRFYGNRQNPHNIFDEKDFNMGGIWLVAQFSFLSAQIIRNIVKQHNILQGAALDDLHIILSIKELYQYRPDEIFEKAKFLSAIIESILSEM